VIRKEMIPLLEAEKNRCTEEGPVRPLSNRVHGKEAGDFLYGRIMGLRRKKGGPARSRKIGLRRQTTTAPPLRTRRQSKGRRL